MAVDPAALRALEAPRRSLPPPPATRTRDRRPLRWARHLGWRHAVAILACAFALFPLVWVFSASVNTSGSLVGQQLIPAEPTLDHYRTLLSGRSVPYTRWLLNTMLIASTVAIGQVFLSSLAAYVFSRMRFAGRRVGLLAILFVQMFPQVLAFVAIFLFMAGLKGTFPAIGLGTRAGLMLVYLGGSLSVNTWLMKGFFDTVPTELDDAAKVDGATHAQVFFRIIIPLAVPVLAVIALLSFIFTINEFLLASVLLNQPEDFTLSVGLQRYISNRYGARWGPFAAGTILGGLPVIALFLFLQRYIVSGLTQGAVKG